MTYNASYDQNDLEPILVDGIGTAGAGFVHYVPLLIITFIIIFLLTALAKVIKATR